MPIGSPPRERRPPAGQRPCKAHGVADNDDFNQDDFNQQVIAEFRANEGRVGGPFEHMRMILITNRGAKSGKEYVTPLVYSTDGDAYVVAASMGGAPKDPQWYRNMVANPDVVVEVGAERFDARVTEATGAERDRLYEQHAADMAFFHDYAAKAGRVIPVLTLRRA
jgi:deazaflavin-dependent oxidoreductase (nitroreductase family)